MYMFQTTIPFKNQNTANTWETFSTPLADGTHLLAPDITTMLTFRSCSFAFLYSLSLMNLLLQDIWLRLFGFELHTNVITLHTFSCRLSPVWMVSLHRCARWTLFNVPFYDYRKLIYAVLLMDVYFASHFCYYKAAAMSSLSHYFRKHFQSVSRPRVSLGKELLDQSFCTLSSRRGGARLFSQMAVYSTSSLRLVPSVRWACIFLKFYQSELKKKLKVSILIGKRLVWD